MAAVVTSGLIAEFTNSPADLPNCRDNAINLTAEYQARTVVTTQWYQSGVGNRQQDGWIPCSDIPNKDLIGDTRIITHNLTVVRNAWRTSNKAKWISINSFGRHTHSSSKPDSSVAAGCLGATGTAVLNCGNTYVFRLKNVKLGDLKNAKNLRFNFSGSADNFIRVKINGHEMDVKGEMKMAPDLMVRNTQDGDFRDLVRIRHLRLTSNQALFCIAMEILLIFISSLVRRTWG